MNSNPKSPALETKANSSGLLACNLIEPSFSFSGITV